MSKKEVQSGIQKIKTGDFFGPRGSTHKGQWEKYRGVGPDADKPRNPKTLQQRLLQVYGAPAEETVKKATGNEVYLQLRGKRDR